MNWNKIWKISGVMMLFLLIVVLIGVFYINKVATGSGEGINPKGYTLIEANGYLFSTRISGNDKGIPVILLHGFPESSEMWISLMSDLNESGYLTIAPDQRGYSFRARPKAIEQYQISHLVTDVISIADSLGIEKFHLIGHDWGSAVGWQLAAEYSERLFSFTALSVPHLSAFTRAYREDSLQFEASKYIRNFQTMKIPEYYLARNKYKLLKTIWTNHHDEEINSYLNLFSQKHALTAALNWYRANYNIFKEASDLGMISVPVLFIWGNKDKAIQRTGVEWTKDYVTDYYRFVELNSSHWLIQESYDSIKMEITLHLAKF